MKKTILICVLCLFTLSGMAQQKRYFSGFITSGLNGKAIPNARVSVVKDSTSAYTNALGFFNLEVSSDTVSISIERAGYYKVDQSFHRNDGDPIRIEIEPLENTEYNAFEPASVTGAFIYNPQPGFIQVDPADARNLPFIFSEPDVVKSLQIHPGVEFASDGFSDMVVRGGGLGQNLLLLDGAPVYSLGHFAGFISNFNTDMVDNLTMYKGAFPARFGGRLASVTEVTSNVGNSKNTTVHIAASPILANLNIGLPIDKKGSSLGVSLRRSYIDLLLNTNTLDIVYRDFNTKLNLVLDDKNSLTFNFFSLADRNRASFTDEDSLGNPTIQTDFGIGMRNRTTSARYSHVHTKRLTASLTGYYTHFNNTILLEETNFQPASGGAPFSDLDVKFSAGEIGLNGDFEFRKDKKSLIRFGLQNKVHQYNSGSLIQTEYDADRNVTDQDKFGDTVLRNGFETALYIEDEYQFSDKLKVNFGLRNVLYSFDGFTRFYPEPRLQGRYLLNPNSSVKFSYTRVNQFTHLYNTDGDATDNFIIWLPATENLKPQGSHLVSLGYATKSADKLQFYSEAYFKSLSNQPIFYSADLFDQTDIEANSLVGTGQVFGWENSLRYVDERSVIYVSGTVSRATRQYDQLNRGDAFSFDYDRRFVGKAGFIMSSGNFIASVNGVLATGNPFTLPTSKYRAIDGSIVLAYDEINNYRADAHKRIDLKIEWFFSDGVQSLELMIYNLLGNRNISSIYSQRDDTSTNSRYIAYTSSSFVFLPFVTYRLRIE
ncbi:MAG: TonB-dependent receptor [Bacteroidia bacterium]|nr:TonB-dependent receptor [Bacteroidia bacterium]